MNRKNLWLIFFIALFVASAVTICAGKKKEFTGPSVKKGDPPPGNAMTLSVSQARAVLKDAMKSKYVGSMHYGGLLGVGKMDGATRALSEIRFRAGGFDIVSPYVWMGHESEGKYAVDFKKEDYVQASGFKFGQMLYSVGNLPDPRWPALGWGGMSGMVPLQFVWSDEQTAQKFADAFNRLLYAASRDEGVDEFESFRVAAKAWRENSAKPPLSPVAERQRILAENAIKERNLNSAIEHYEAGLEAQPMWPAGWFNLALIYAEQSNYVDAADRMKHYLELAPDAADAQSAREQMIIWDDKARQTSSLGAANR